MSERIEKLIEQFMHENPYGDTMELATFMYEKGKKDGYAEGYKAWLCRGL